jgi:translation initiation factor IF-3
MAKKSKSPEHRINEYIRVPEVRLIFDGKDSEIVDTRKALKMAYDSELDLVEVSPNAKPPVCKIIDYKKFLYEQRKKDKELKSKSKQTSIKEIRFGPNTDDHDFNFKLEHARDFLSKGDKVKATILFKGRAIVYKDRGEILLLKFADGLSDLGLPERMPVLEGKKMIIMINPKKK